MSLYFFIEFFFFFFNDTATTEIYTLSLHDALPISRCRRRRLLGRSADRSPRPHRRQRDRKSTRLNSSHSSISYAVFCLKKKKKNLNNIAVNFEQKVHDRTRFFKKLSLFRRAFDMMS